MDILAYLRQHGGYAQLKDLKRTAVEYREIDKLLREGIIEKIKPGLYRLATLSSEGDANIHFVDVCRAAPESVICLASALDYYNLTTFHPSQIQAAIPHPAKPPVIEYPPVKFYYFRERFYKPGMEYLKTDNGIIRIYNKEKTVCDMFRYRNKLGEDLALEGLKNYLKQPDANLKRLREYALICQVKTVMLPYLKALLVE